MTARFFVFIWGTILLTLLSFTALVTLMDWSAPKFAQDEIELALVRRELSEVARTGGVDAALDLWRQIAPAHDAITVAPAPDCAAPDAVQASAGRCLSVKLAASAESDLSHIQPMLVPLMLGAVISALAALVLSRWLTHPIRVVNQGLRHLAGRQLATRIRPQLAPSDRELAELVTAFDEAASQLQQFSEERQSLFHDISHEIRSPLARLRAAIGLIERHPQRAEDLLGQMSTDIGRLDHLVDEILMLARLERADTLGATERLDLLDVLEPILTDARFEGQPRNITLRYEGPDLIPATGNAELLHRSFENVIRNALTYSPDGGEVLIRARRQTGRITIEITDQGGGVAEEDLVRMFKPFVRLGDMGRAKGAGLGLAIAARGIELHGGSIRGQNRAGGGLMVVIELGVNPIHSGM